MACIILTDTATSYSPFGKKGTKRKDVTHDNTREDIKEFKFNSSNESLDEINNACKHDHDAHKKNKTELKTVDLTDEATNDAFIALGSSSGNFTYYYRLYIL